jgi:hypothetical protein
MSPGIRLDCQNPILCDRLGEHHKPPAKTPKRHGSHSEKEVKAGPQDHALRGAVGFLPTVHTMRVDIIRPLTFG